MTASSSIGGAAAPASPFNAALFDAATDVVALMDRDLRYLYVNPAVEAYVGRPARDFIGRTNEEMGSSPENAAYWRERMNEVLASGRPIGFEFDFEAPGSRRRFQATAAPVCDADGRPESVLVISRDITDTRASRLLEGAVHHLPTAVAPVEAPSGRLLLRNQKATDIFRVQPTVTEGVADYRAFVGFRPDGTRYQPEEWPLSRSILHGEVVSGEVVEILRGDGTRGFIRITSAPVRDASGAIIAGLVTFDDVTDEAGLVRDNARLFAAEREARAEAETLHRIGSTLASKLELKAVLQAVTDETTVLTRAEFGAFFYNAITDRGEAYLLYTLSGAPAEAFAKFPAPRATALFGPTFRGEGVIRLDDVRQDPRYGKNAPHHGMPPGHLPVRSYLAVPVRSRSGEVLGGLFFGHSEVGRFTARHAYLVEAVAAQAAVAIDNARLFDQARAAEAAQARRAEELQVTEERLRLAVEGANVGLWNYEITSGRLFLDARIREQFGLDADGAVTLQEFYALVHPDDRHGLEAAFVRAVEHRESYDVEYRIGPSGSPRWVRSLARAAYLADGTAYRIDGITLDITDRKRTEEDRAHLLQRERDARSETESALKTRDDFLAAASHELRNPLNALQLQLGGLRRIARRDPAALATPAVAGRLDKTEEQITRLVRLVDTLLDVSRIKSGRLNLEYADIDLVAVARDVVRQIEPIAGRTAIRLTAPDTITGRWDSLRVEQVLTNLLSNALKYGDGKPVDLTLAADDRTARIEVTDEGIGIPADMISRLFARFERLTPDHRRGGFGLGLWITRQVVNAFGGRIDVRSELGKGSTFCVELPRRPSASGEREGSDAVW